MALNRINKLTSYIKAKEYGKAKDALGLFACSIVPGGNRFTHRFTGDKRVLAEVLSKFYGYVQEKEDSKKLNVDIIVQDGDKFPKSSAFIRLIGPLSHPIVRKDVSLAVHSGFNPQLRKNANICIVQRTAVSDTTTAQELIDYLAVKNIPLVIDTDDALFALDEHHPEFKLGGGKYGAFSLLLKHAAQLWVSTPKLKGHYNSVASCPVFVIPNSIDNRLWRKFEPESVQPTRPLQILYAGTATHNKDFEMLVSWLDEVHAQKPNSFELTVVGVTSSLPFKEWLRTVRRSRDTVIYPKFARWLQSQGPFDIGVSPLVDNKFNTYKSDIKALDYLAISALPIVSKLEPYNTKELKPFIVSLPNTEKAWVEYFISVLANVEEFRQNSLNTISDAQNYLYMSRGTERTAKKLLKQLQNTQ